MREVRGVGGDEEGVIAWESWRGKEMGYGLMGMNVDFLGEEVFR